jgi:hypothetical protein
VIPAVRSELRKFFTTRMWWGLALGMVVIGGGLAATFGLLAGRGDPAQGGLPDLGQQGMVTTTYTAGLSFAYLLTLVIGVMSLGAEHRHKTITSTFLATPHRARVMASKAVAMIAIGAFYGLLYVASAFAVGATVIALRGYEVLPSDENVPRSLALSLLALGLWALMGLGVGILIRNQVAALLISVAVAWIGQFLIILLLNGLGWTAATAYLPGQATSAMVSQVNGSGQGIAIEQLSWWAAALLLTGYAAVLAGLGTWRTIRSDIS